MSQPCINGCGIDTNNPSGVCTICEKFGYEKDKTSPPSMGGEKGEGGMSVKKPCSTPGCGRPVQKEGLCYKCYKEKHGKAPYPGQDNTKEKTHRTCSVEGCGKYGVKNGMCIKHYKEILAETRAGKPASRQAGKQTNGKSACLGQLLYASDLLDGQLNNALDLGIIDTKIILDIRSRLGAILRGSVDI